MFKYKSSNEKTIRVSFISQFNVHHHGKMEKCNVDMMDRSAMHANFHHLLYSYVFL